MVQINFQEHSRCRKKSSSSVKLSVLRGLNKQTNLLNKFFIVRLVLVKHIEASHSNIFVLNVAISI